MPYLVPFKSNGKVGYKDAHDRVVIEPTFDFGGDFHTKEEWDFPYARVGNCGLYGMIDKTGNIIIPLVYENVSWLGDGFFLIKKNKRFGVASITGDEIVPVIYYSIIYHKGLFQCRKDRLHLVKHWGYTRAQERNSVFDIYQEDEPFVSDVWYNTNGDKIYEGKVIEASCHNLIIDKDGCVGVMNSLGRVIVECQYSEIHCAREDRFVVRRDEDTGWSVGVINAQGESVIPFVYKCIRFINGTFYECFVESTTTINDSDKPNSKYNYYPVGQGVWITSGGVIINVGKAEVLSENYLVYFANNLKGVVNKSGDIIVNPLYDDIDVIEGNLVVERDGLIGILGKSGEIIINPVYTSIEFARIHADADYSQTGDTNEYGTYGPVNTFYSEQVSFLHIPPSYYGTLDRSNKTSIPTYDHKLNTSFCSFKKTLILHTSSYSELYIRSIGLVPNSKFERIEQMTSIHFAVLKNNKWGVFNMNEQKLSIPCSYDRIAYNTGHIVYISIGDLWGAFSLSFDHSISDAEEVSIEPSFYAIESIDPLQTLFSVKRSHLYFNNKQEYTIVDSSGHEVNAMSNHSWDYDDLPSSCFSVPFVFFRMDRILCGSGGKFGFIGLDSYKGYISIPLKYDLIEERTTKYGTHKDGMFDICLKRVSDEESSIDEWGVLDLEGKEVVPVKYSKRLPYDFGHEPVKDAISGRIGVLDDDGSELIPCIYEYLEKKGTNYAYGYYYDHSLYRIESSRDEKVWGIIDQKGQKITPPKYDFITHKLGFNIAGRDGYFGMNSSKYFGVYDIYNQKGDFLLGGIRYLDLNYTPDFYKCFVGGHWDIERYSDEYDNYCENSDFVSEDGGWLVLDQNLNSLIKTNEGKLYTFPKGAIIDYSEEQDGIHSSFPQEILLKNEPALSEEYIIIHDDDSSKVLHIGDDDFSNPFPFLAYVGGNLFFALDTNRRVDLFCYNSEVALLSGYALFTYPIEDWFFGIKVVGEGLCNVDLFHISGDTIEQYRAATEKPIKDANWMLNNALFRIKIDENETGIRSVAVCGKTQSSFFDSDFLGRICQSSLSLEPYKTDKSCTGNKWCSNKTIRMV